ncbi:cysteine--tRNA ligase [Candidatus Saganbacteria bacterium]|nr:cysteine--tRNA ligase [Candidatus Saganbacteria bacterium]
MVLRLFNTLSGEKEIFFPLNPPQVKMYVCGITPYDATHLGHGRAYVTFDVVRRYLKFSGFQVTYVQNLTDIDDKIIKKSEINTKSENQNIKQKCREIVEKYTTEYFEVMDQLNVLRADQYPKATEMIPDMIKVIQRLIERGCAYVAGNDVYFSVASFADYGKLSKRKKKDLLAGARMGINESKKDPLDFALWKGAKPGEPSWSAPWGEGRPGWHIECSTMSNKLLGETFDIHGGGRDLIFPHHENEIAQAQAYNGKLFVKYWLHNGFVNINQQKMSKSLGNFFTLKDIFRKFAPLVVRLFLLLTHYRSPINYSDQELASAKEAYNRLVRFIADLDFRLQKTNDSAPQIELVGLQDELLEFKNKFITAMDDDFNTAGALAEIFNLVHYCRKKMEAGEIERECLIVMKQTVEHLCGILGLMIKTEAAVSDKITPEVERLIAEREIARKAKNFQQADEIRQKLTLMGVIIEDTPQGTRRLKNA